MNRLAGTLALGALVVLSACGKPAGTTDGGGGEPSYPPPPASAPVLGGMDLSQDLDLNGTEPFWSLQIRTDALTLSGPDRAKITAPNPGPQVSAHAAVWEAKSADGKGLKVTLTDTACSDGMSDRSYPLSAMVTGVGRDALKGCADAAKPAGDGQPAGKP